MWFIDQRSIHHLCRCTNAQPRGASARTRTALNTHAPSLLETRRRGAALPRHTFAPRRRETAQQTRRYVAGTSGLPPMRPRSTTFGRRITRKLSWPNGQGVALQGRRLRVRVPLGAPSTRRVMKKINAKKKHEGRPVRFLTAVGAKKSERQFNQERNHYALSAKTGRCQRRFYGRRRDQDSTRRRRAARATIGAHASAKRRRRRPARAARRAARSSHWRTYLRAPAPQASQMYSPRGALARPTHSRWNQLSQPPSHAIISPW